SFLGNPTRRFGYAAQTRGMRKKVSYLWYPGGQPRPPVNPPKGISRAGTHIVLIIVREELAFIGSHIHLYGTVTLASFAGQTQIQCLFDRLVIPVVCYEVPLQHLKQHARATARGILFFARHHIAGTHGASFVTPAVTHAHAA